MTNPPVYIILTTYKRKDTCLRTVRSLKTNLLYDNLGWFICDDHSPEPYVEDIVQEISSPNIYIYDGNRRGVGHMMNYALKHLWGLGVNTILMMEDDWELEKPLDLFPYVKVLNDHPEYSLIRFGYLSTNLLGYTVGVEGKLFWRIEDNKETYRFTGHPSLRHRRFHDKTLGGVGMYDEGLTAGMTELSMCGKTNMYGPNPSNILYPCEAGQWGFFAHIGGEHLGNIEPEKA